jgi:hypothetical protein
MVALHKHYPVEKLIAFFRGNEAVNTFYTLGTTEADREKLSAVKRQVEITKICLDVANGYTEKFLDAVKRTRDENPTATIMAGIVVTGDMNGGPRPCRSGHRQGRDWPRFRLHDPRAHRRRIPAALSRHRMF